jgi:hypothetical protein
MFVGRVVLGMSRAGQNALWVAYQKTRGKGGISPASQSPSILLRPGPFRVSTVSGGNLRAIGQDIEIIRYSLQSAYPQNTQHGSFSISSINDCRRLVGWSSAYFSHLPDALIQYSCQTKVSGSYLSRAIGVSVHS